MGCWWGVYTGTLACTIRKCVCTGCPLGGVWDETPNGSNSHSSQCISPMFCPLCVILVILVFVCRFTWPAGHGHQMGTGAITRSQFCMSHERESCGTFHSHNQSKPDTQWKQNWHMGQTKHPGHGAFSTCTWCVAQNWDSSYPLPPFPIYSSSKHFEKCWMGRIHFHNSWIHNICQGTAGSSHLFPWLAQEVYQNIVSPAKQTYHRSGKEAGGKLMAHGFHRSCIPRPDLLTVTVS